MVSRVNCAIQEPENHKLHNPGPAFERILPMSTKEEGTDAQ